jgi:hypothetical protein
MLCRKKKNDKLSKNTIFAVKFIFKKSLIMERFHEIIGMFMPLVIALIALGASIYTQRSLRRREAEAKAEAKADAKAETLRHEAREDALRREAEAKEAAHIRKEFLIGVIMNRNLPKSQREPFMDEYRKSGNNGTIIEFWEREE